MKLEKYLVLNKYLLSLFGANSMMDLDLIVSYVTSAVSSHLTREL